MNAALYPPTSAMAVANWFLTRAWREPNVPVVDQLKLYKLVYYAHAWYLGNGRGPLFEEDIEAWPHGPVVRDLYIEFHRTGRGAIRGLGKQLVKRDGKFQIDRPVYEGDLEPYLEQVWDTYKVYSGIRLSNSTHADGEPWTVVKDKLGLDGKPTIPNKLIAEVFNVKVEAS
ncbi:MAG: DUF4065 domain-containing protein [Rhodobacteraceae bacterium]|nr:DUF4065 domain-containing protein [Paracoccaceae bacterium]